MVHFQIWIECGPWLKESFPAENLFCQKMEASSANSTARLPADLNLGFEPTHLIYRIDIEKHRPKKLNDANHSVNYF